MNGVGVGRGNRGTGGEVIRVDLLDQTRVVDHHLSGPKVRRGVTSAVHQFLSHAAVQKGNLGHVHVRLDLRRLIG